MSEKSETKEPIFVCGLGRSGTGLISKSLGQSTELVYIKEAWLISKLEGLAEWYSMLYDQWKGFTPWNEKGLDRKILIRELSQFYYGLLRLASEGHRFIEKTPEWNALHCKFLNELFPDAFYILIYRDGRNYVASTESKKIQQKEEFNFEKYCRNWAKVMDLFQEVCEKKTIKHMRLVRYESLLLRFDEIFIDLCNFVKIKPFKPIPYEPNSSFENYLTLDDFNNRWKSWSDEKKNIFKRYASSQLIKWKYVESNDSW